MEDDEVRTVRVAALNKGMGVLETAAMLGTVTIMFLGLIGLPLVGGYMMYRKGWLWFLAWVVCASLIVYSQDTLGGGVFMLFICTSYFIPYWLGLLFTRRRA